jgi:hypothetical protein
MLTREWSNDCCALSGLGFLPSAGILFQSIEKSAWAEYRGWPAKTLPTMMQNTVAAAIGKSLFMTIIGK